jgi:hypothetical protein
MDLNKTFSGYIHGLGENLTKATVLKFGSRAVKLPYIGEPEIRVLPSVDSITKRNEAFTFVISYFEAKKYKNIRSEFLNLPNENKVTLIQEDTFHEWLVLKSFEYKMTDLDCKSSQETAEKVSAFLAAKFPFSKEGAEVFRLENFDVGYIHYNKDSKTALLVVLNEPNVLRISIKISDMAMFEKWLEE